MVRTKDPRLKGDLEFAITEEAHAGAQETLFANLRRDEYERGFLATLHVSSGLRRRTLLHANIVPQEHGEVRWTNDGLMMEASYYSRAVQQARKEDAGLLHVHSHPGPNRDPRPSDPSGRDLEVAIDRLWHVARKLPGKPVAAAVVTPSGAWNVREYVYNLPANSSQLDDPWFQASAGRFRYSQRTRIVGAGLSIRTGTMDSAESDIDSVPAESSIRLWGVAGQRILSGLRVGIAGVGGVGGMIAEHLARLGVGELVMVDYDTLEPANLNRSQGATREDAILRRPKVEVYAALAARSATAPQFKIAWHQESIVEEAGIKPLLDCDIIIAAADDAWARQVLDHAAYSHLIPVLDGGTRLIPDSEGEALRFGKTQLASAGPGHPCLECQDVYTKADVSESQEEPGMRERYVESNEFVDSRELRAPSVISTNALVAALMGLRLIAICLGTTPKARIGTQRYHIPTGRLAWTPDTACRPTCSRRRLTARGDDHSLPLGTDLRKATR